MNSSGRSASRWSRIHGSSSRIVTCGTKQHCMLVLLKPLTESWSRAAARKG